MATLVLTAVGTAIGGPLGGAIGALIGRQADGALFAPRRRHGPRLGDLAVQTSSYGTPIPRLFGTMRVAGTVIWATDIKERRSSSSGGKGQPRTVGYSYSTSFAVALSGREVLEVRRIWADGKLLRGAAGDFKTRTGYRLHNGNDGQAPDPLIAAAEGIGRASAFRGIAYATFENFELADYGNRIPSLTFEVVADAGPVAVGAIAAALSDGVVAAGDTPSLDGYAASGDSVRGALEGLADILPVSLVAGDDGPVMTAARAEAATIDPVAMLVAGEGDGGMEIVRRTSQAAPGDVTIAYHDPARDYQTGLQRATRGGEGQCGEDHALPAVLSAASAKLYAEHRLASAWAARSTAKLTVTLRDGGSRPGGLVRIAGTPGLWKIARWTLEHMAAKLELVRVPAALPAAGTGTDPGRPGDQPDLPLGPTTLHLFDLPLYDERIGDRPRLLAVGGGAGGGWRGAPLTTSLDDGESWAAAGGVTAARAIGTADQALPTGGSALIDTAASVEVTLLHPAMWLESRSDAALAGGANLAVIGEELIQFGSAEPLGAGRFRLGRLLRGRRGTEWAAALHAVGDVFALIEADAATLIEPPAAALGATLRATADGVGDDGGAEASCAVTGEAMRPPAPVHLSAGRRADGAIAVQWVRRSRAGWAWLDGGDAPLGEESEAYLLTLSGAGFSRTAAAAAPYHLYTAAEQAADGLEGPLTIAVRQTGTLAPSRPATIEYHEGD